MKPLITKAEVLNKFRTALVAKLTKEGIEFRWPADDMIAVEVPNEHAVQAEVLIQEVLGECG